MRISIDKFKGTGVALVTPFHKYGSIDFAALSTMVEHVISGGVDYIVALGTTSEAATLTPDEMIAVVELIVEVNQDRVPIVMGLGGNNTRHIENSLSNLRYLNHIDAVLSVTPYYNKPNQKGLYYHYKSLSQATALPIILYNVPGRTAVNMTAETTLRLAHEFDNIIGVKEASGNMVQCMQIARDKPKNFLLISGDDALTYNMMGVGAEGVISVVANAYPKEMSAMVRNAMQKNYDKALSLHFGLLDFMEMIFEDGNPAGIKSALSTMELIKHNLRLPLVKTNVQTANRIKQFIESYKPNL